MIRLIDKDGDPFEAFGFSHVIPCDADGIALPDEWVGDLVLYGFNNLGKAKDMAPAAYVTEDQMKMFVSRALSSYDKLMPGRMAGMKACTL